MTVPILFPLLFPSGKQQIDLVVLVTPEDCIPPASGLQGRDRLQGGEVSQLLPRFPFGCVETQ